MFAKSVGAVAGIGGLALGVFLLLFREFIRRTFFPRLEKQDAYRLLRLFLVLVFQLRLQDLRMGLGRDAFKIADEGGTSEALIQQWTQKTRSSQ